jgi:hypothetical protein
VRSGGKGGGVNKFSSLAHCISLFFLHICVFCICGEWGWGWGAKLNGFVLIDINEAYRPTRNDTLSTD